MVHNIETILQNISRKQIQQIYIRMFGKRVFYKKHKCINLLLKPL